MMTSSNLTNLSVDTNFNTIIKIRGILLPGKRLYNLFHCQVIDINVFIVFRMMTSSILIDLTVDSDFNTISEISIISYP